MLPRSRLSRIGKVTVLNQNVGPEHRASVKLVYLHHQPWL